MRIRDRAGTPQIQLNGLSILLLFHIFGGAGVSTESGIPDFRSVDGLYHQKYDYPPETLSLIHI